jgi:hypothetical protein
VSKKVEKIQGQRLSELLQQQSNMLLQPNSPAGWDADGQSSQVIHGHSVAV